MDDSMIDLMAGDAMLRRRLEAYAEDRLSPDLATSSRLRARVLAVAHRQADLARADASLTVLSGADPGSNRWLRDRLTAEARGARSDLPAEALARRRPSSAWRRTASVVLAASLGLGLITGSALAARPGGPLYPTRIWAETLTLPTDPSERALAELERLEARLSEATAASAAGDSIGAGAALDAYESIVGQASAAAIVAGDSVASAVLETGVSRNVAVLQALSGRVPDTAGAAIDRAIERAIDRSGAAIDAIETAKPGNGGGPTDGGGPGGRPEATPKPTKAPTPEPAVTAQPTPKPTKEPTAQPTPRPTHKPKPDPTPKATKDTGKPDDPGQPDPTPRRSGHPGGD
jgi:cell division septation protein DedD